MIILMPWWIAMLSWASLWNTMPDDELLRSAASGELNGSGDVERVARRGIDGHSDEIGKFIETLPGGVKHTIFKARWDGPLDDTQIFIVPAGHIFAMGDNRDNSLDSRVAPEDGGVGYVPAENLVARADVMLGSYDYLNAHSIRT